MISDRTDIFNFLKCFNLGSLYILCPGGDDKANEYKIGSRIPFTMLPCIQSHFKWIFSLPVMFIGLSLLCDPAINDKTQLYRLKDKNVIG